MRRSSRSRTLAPISLRTGTGVTSPPAGPLLAGSHKVPFECNHAGWLGASMPAIFEFAPRKGQPGPCNDLSGDQRRHTWKSRVFALPGLPIIDARNASNKGRER